MPGGYYRRFVQMCIANADVRRTLVGRPLREGFTEESAWLGEVRQRCVTGLLKNPRGLVKFVDDKLNFVGRWRSNVRRTLVCRQFRDRLLRNPGGLVKFVNDKLKFVGRWRSNVRRTLVCRQLRARLLRNPRGLVKVVNDKLNFVGRWRSNVRRTLVCRQFRDRLLRNPRGLVKFVNDKLKFVEQSVRPTALIVG